MATTRSPVDGLINQKTQQQVPLKEISIQAEIKACLLGLRSHLKYANDSPDPVEVVFRFPLEDSSAVVGLSAVIDGRRIKADLREKEKARAAYDDAIASGQSAALAEEKAGDIFSIILGNLPPGKEAEIDLQIVAELPIDAEGNVHFSLPSVLKPRYTPTGSSDPLAKVPQSGSHFNQIAGFRRFELCVSKSEHIKSVTSPTHTLGVLGSGSKFFVSLTDKAPLGKDMVILIKPKKPHQPSAVVEEGNTQGTEFMSGKAVMVSFFPKFEHKKSKCEFIFLVDRSGGMRGQFIQSARETLILFLKSLPEDCHFNIIGFGSSYEQLFPEGSVPYSQSTLDEAVKHSTSLQADLGGTELLSPLEFIFKTKTPPGLSRQVFVLTDGDVSNTDACVQKVKANNDSSRCFTFGIGSGASTTLVEGLAQAGNGSAEFVKKGERLQPKVIRSLKRALQPAVTDVSVKFLIDGNPDILQSPQSLPPVFAGEKLVVYAVVKTAVESDKLTGKAILSSKISGQSISETVEIKNGPPLMGLAVQTVHHLAAKALIKDWQREGREKGEIVTLSVESSVVSSYTAFIAVDEENSEPIEGALQTWDLKDYIQFEGAILGSSAGLITKTYDRYCQERPRFISPRCDEAPQEWSVRRHRDQDRSRRRRQRRSRSRSRSRSPKPLMKSREDFMKKEKHYHKKKSTSVVSLSAIVRAQQADGSWVLNSELARFVGRSVEEITSGCPVVECEGVVGSVWATLLVLELLHSKYKNDIEEWELLGAKGESWTEKQSLPTELTLSQLKAAAKKLIKSFQEL